MNTYVYKDGKRVKIYEGDKIEEVKDEKKDQKLENLDNSEKSLYDQLQEKSALSCDILDHFDLNDDESILAILPFVKGGTFENFAQAMGAIEAFVHVPEADEHEDYLFDDFDPTTVALLKTLGLEDDVQLSDMMEVVNGANKLEKIANFGKIQKILLPYMEIPVTEKEPAGVDKKEELPTGTDNDYFIESVDDDNKKEEKTETIIEDKKEEEPSIELDNDSFIESTGGDKKEKVVVPVVEEKKELPTGTDNDLFIEPAIEIAPEVKNETDNQIVELAEEELKEKEINLTKLEPIKAKLLDIVKTAEPKLKQRAEIVMDKIEVSEIEEELKSEEINLQKLEPRKPKLLEIVARAEPELKQRAVVVLDKIELVEEENADIPKVDEIVPEVKNETIVESANETKENTTDLDKLYEIKKDQYLLLHVEPIKADLPALQRLVKDIDDNIKSENYKKEFADISNDLKRATEIYNQLQILNIAKEKASNYIDELEYNIDKEFYISELDKAGDNLSKLELFLADVNKKIDDIVGKQRKKGLLRTKEQKAKLQRSKEILQDIKIEAENRVKEQERLVGIIEEIDVDATFPDELLDGIATEEEKQVYWDKKAQLYGLTAATSDYLRESNPKKRAIRNIDDKLSEMGEPADPILKREKKSLESDKKKLEKELNKIKEPQEIKEQEKLLQELNSIKQKAENERRIKANEESSNK
ncbi:hypothetical protein KKH82_06165 [Patescibacteria group bacterium]|nr:hypothetical protein [Patescibacteria group bacterium]